MNYDQQNTDFSSQDQPRRRNQQQQDPSGLDTTQDTGYNQSGMDTGNNFGSSGTQGIADKADLLDQDTSGQGQYGNQTSDVCDMPGGARGTQDIGSNTDTTSGQQYGGQQQYGGDDTNMSSGGGYGSTGQSGTQGMGTSTGTTGDYPMGSQDPSMTQSSGMDPLSQGGQAQGGQGQGGTQSWNEPSTGGNQYGGNVQSGQPSATDKIMGGMKKFAGKLQSDPNKMAEGDQQQRTGDPNLI